MSDMPVECKTLGYAGYGLQPPETRWSKHVAERLATVGIDTYTNNSNEKSSGMPDTVMQGTFGFVYVEFKGLTTPVRGNQALIAAKMNAKSFYSRGELCCFVYRAPNIFGILRKDCSIVKLFECDALSNPLEFRYLLTSTINAVQQNDSYDAIKVRAESYSLPVLPMKQYAVREINRTGPSEHAVFAPSAELAIKSVVGAPILSRIHLVKDSFYTVQESE